MKKKIRIILLSALMLAFVLFAAACSASADSISVSDSSEFQTVYVLGSELDLSDLKLSVVSGGKETQLTADAKGVTVSGYDKSTPGKQTVKIEYGGAYTEITVTVAERLTVGGALTDYLVGEELDKSRGVVRITDYNGSVRTLQLSSEFLTVSGFDSGTPGVGKAVTVTYTNGEETCEGTLAVNIYAVDEIDFHRPTRITYSSHYEGTPDASGGRFVLKGNGGAVKREIAISEDMISGLDVSAVSAQTPSLTQTLTVTYGGKPYTYDVQLTYSDVSLFLDNAATFAEVDWEGESEPVIEEELGELAVKLMEAYFDIPTADRALIGEELAFDVARCAMVYGFELWAEDIRAFGGAFAFELGECVLHLESYDAVKSALLLFDDKDSAIYTVSPLLLKLIDEYGDSVIYENETERIRFSTYPVMDSYELTVMKAMLQHSLTVYDLLATVPADWRTEGLDAHEEKLTQATVAILSETYVLDHPDMYYLISEWREGNDIFDILYTFLYESGNERLMKSLVMYGLPEGVRSAYVYTLTAFLAMDDLQNAKTLDTTKLIYNYLCASDAAKSLIADADSADGYLFTSVPVDLLFGVDFEGNVTFEYMVEYVRAAVLDLTDALIEQEPYASLAYDYAHLIDNIVNTQGYENTEAYGEDIKGIIEGFASLSPTQQYSVLSFFNMLYSRGIPELAFDGSGEYAGYASIFNRLINEFMSTKLTAENYSVYTDLILAIEVFANRFDYPGWQSDFEGRMDRVTAAIPNLEGSDKASFEYYLGKAYEKYAAIRADLAKAAELGELEGDFAELYRVLRDVQTASYYMSTGTTYNYTYFLASYERASEISRRILGSGSESAIYAYYYVPLFEAYEDGDGNTVLWSCDYALAAYRTVYKDSLLHLGTTGANVYDTYYELGMDKFLAAYYGTVSAFLNKSEGQEAVFDKENMLAVIKAYSALPSATKALFASLEGGVDIYGSALELFVGEAFTDEAAAVARKLFALERAFYTYEVSESGVALSTLGELLSQLEALYVPLSGEAKASFEPLEEIYAYYVGECGRLLA